MAYRPLRLGAGCPEPVRRYCHVWLSMWFQEAHWLLSRESEPKSAAFQPAFSHATALLLLAIADGISKVFYRTTNKRSGERFRGLLADYYPWELEPPGGADRTNGPRLLYKGLRNPFTHELGAPDRTIGGIGILAMSFPEADLEALEESLTRPPLADRTLDIHDGKPSLHIPGFYWGLREMVYRLAGDAARMRSILPDLR